MTTIVRVLGSNKIIACISKALVTSNVIDLVSFLGFSGLILWQVWREEKSINAFLEAETDNKTDS